MEFKEMIKLAKGLDSKDKQQLILILQSETKGSNQVFGALPGVVPLSRQQGIREHNVE
ncbi:hypothetical protein [Paenibacillus sp. R14(2021)]|uniref:hypothetical protein n=1 Tax=Paenibacillus sp. R14(2021) TaxID=2859228 RepID=UPI001C6161CF|nr:hypothetical protein [Paenibacillus sp. R14(2021)]